MRRKHHDLQVWQLEMDLVKAVYGLPRQFPDSEKFGLCSQMQRAAVSIPSNISEGAARIGNREFLHFLSLARGSLCELETQIMIGRELGYIENEQEILELINQLFAKLSALINTTRKKAME
jgi:four helix bundle protein